MSDRATLDEVVHHLCIDAKGLVSPHMTDGKWALPSREHVLYAIEDIRSVFFPGYFRTVDLQDDRLHYFVGATVDRAIRTLEEQTARGIAFVAGHDFRGCAHCTGQARAISDGFLRRLPAVRTLCASDIEAAFSGDPALLSRDEAILCYPGVHAILHQRIAHELSNLGVPLIPRMITEHTHSVTGIDIHPGAQIGERFFIDHGTGVVIGETCIIGAGVRVYQGVTLGAKVIPRDVQTQPIKGGARHPIVEDDVVIYAGATILGRVTIGQGSTIGGNVWLTQSVPPGSRITLNGPRDGANTSA